MLGEHIGSQKNEEVDIQELFQALWSRKILILVVMLISLLCAAAYAYLSKPEYEARGYVVPPTQNDIANINYGRTKDSELNPYTVKDVYGFFVGALLAESLRQDFFSNVYLPSLSESERQKPQDVIYGDFSKKLSVSLPGKDLPDRYSVVVQNNNPAEAVEWVKLYISRASELAKQELISNVSREAEVWARNLEQQIKASRENSQKTREDSIVKLREALQVAEAIGIEKPPVITGSPTVEIAGSMDGSHIYMRGTKALKAEIENLESRKSDDPFIASLREMQGKYEFYKGVEIRAADIAVYRMDGAVEQPETPVKPLKSLVMVLGLLFGLIVGAGYVLVSYLFGRGH